MVRPKICAHRRGYSGFLRILRTEWDERPPEHASDYGGSNCLYKRFSIIRLINDLARTRSGCKLRLETKYIFPRCCVHFGVIGRVLCTELYAHPPDHAYHIRESNGLCQRF